MSPLSTIRKKVARSRLAKDTATIGIGQILRVGLQAVYFVLIARTLGPGQYGAFVAMTAMVAVVANFVGLGCPNILLKNVCRNRSMLPVYWGNGLLIILATGCLLGCGVLGAGRFVFSRDLQFPLLLVCISDLFFTRITELASFAFSAVGNMFQTATLNVNISLSRLVAIAILGTVKAHPGVRDWSIAYVLGSLACCLYAFLRLMWIARSIRLDLGRMRKEIVEGAYFAVSVSAATVYNDIDKTMLARLSDMASTGIYGAAYRIIDVTMTPVRSLAAACYPEFFRRGQSGIRSTLRYARTQIGRTALYGLAVFVVLELSAPLFPRVVGEGYRSSVEAIRWLALIPFLRCIHMFLADALAGAGHQGARTFVQIVIGALNVWLNVPFILRWSWHGAAWTSLMCDGALVVGLWGMAMWVRHSSKQKVVPFPQLEDGVIDHNV